MLLTAWTPQDFRTTAQFSGDGKVVNTEAAVAVVQTASGRTWMHVYFYAFPFTPEDVAAFSGGSIAALEQKRLQLTRSGLDINRSRAAMHLLVDNGWRLSNASVEIPGLTCTFFSDPMLSKGAIQSFVTDGTRLRLRAKSETVCDLTAVGGGKPRMSYAVDVNLPVFTPR
jgi:hypothetical protein